jgi:hypothetical protein
MNEKVKHALETTLKNWKTMTGTENDDAEGAANQFESSFYLFIDAVRGWVNGLENRPQTLEEFLDLSEITTILDLLPLPLHLNFETEAELILEDKSRIDEDKYD